MLEHERNAQLNNDLYTTDARPFASAEAESEVVGNGKVIDLVLPVIVLIICCIIGMIYTGGFFEGESFINAFAHCSAPTGLLLGSAAALLITFLLYIPRRVLTFHQFMEALPEGFKAMVPAIMILTFAWTLSGITGLLGADVFSCGYSGKQHRRFAGLYPHYRILYRGVPCICNRYLLGYFRYSPAYRCAYYADRQ